MTQLNPLLKKLNRILIVMNKANKTFGFCGMKKFYMNIIIILFLGIFKPINSYAYQKELFRDDGSLCKVDEELVAGCYLRNKKIVSICGNSGNDNVFYRYGDRDNIDSEYEKGINNRFYFINESGGSVSSFSIVVDSGDYQYHLAEANNSMSLSFYNSSNDKLIFLERCKPKFLMNDLEKKSYKNTYVFPNLETIKFLFKEKND